MLFVIAERCCDSTEASRPAIKPGRTSEWINVPGDSRQNEFHHRRLLIPGAAFFSDNALACHKYDSHKIRPVTFHGFSLSLWPVPSASKGSNARFLSDVIAAVRINLRAVCSFLSLSFLTTDRLLQVNCSFDTFWNSDAFELNKSHFPKRFYI